VQAANEKPERLVGFAPAVIPIWLSRAVSSVASPGGCTRIVRPQLRGSCMCLGRDRGACRVLASAWSLDA
jgi:hypothetical protein